MANLPVLVSAAGRQGRLATKSHKKRRSGTDIPSLPGGASIVGLAIFVSLRDFSRPKFSRLDPGLWHRAGMALELAPPEFEPVIPSVQKFFREEFEQELSELRARLLLEYVPKDRPVRLQPGR